MLPTSNKSRKLLTDNIIIPDDTFDNSWLASGPVLLVILRKGILFFHETIEHKNVHKPWNKVHK